MVVRENTNVTLRCATTGFPKPTVTWRREDEQKITLVDQSGMGLFPPQSLIPSTVVIIIALSLCPLFHCIIERDDANSLIFYIRFSNMNSKLWSGYGIINGDRGGSGRSCFQSDQSESSSHGCLSLHCIQWRTTHRVPSDYSHCPL